MVSDGRGVPRKVDKAKYYGVKTPIGFDVQTNPIET